MRLLAPLALAVLVGCTATNPDRPTRPGADVPDETGDSGFEDEEERPDLPMGYDDDPARKACSLVGDGGDNIIAASSMGEAGQVIILPSDNGEAFNVKMPDSGPGFVTIEIGDWMTTVRFFADDLATYTIHGNSPEDLTGLRANGACPDERISDNRWAFHEWGSYVIEFSAESPREIWFVAVKES